jgi:acyl-CoA reductase-like NAD-dependent aldehyde dehydrogenase
MLASATSVATRWFPTREVQCRVQPRTAVRPDVVTVLRQGLATKLHRVADQLACRVSVEADASVVDDMVARAVAAQKAFETWPEVQVDALLQDIVDTIAEHAEELATATVEETGMGVVEDKVAKIRFFSRGTYRTLAGQPGVGVVRRDGQTKVTEIATPMGVVLGLIPVTSPVIVLVFKALICLKTRNALIASCHHAALGVGNRVEELIQAVLRRHGAPVDLVQCIRERTSRKLTSLFMEHKDMAFILATGGPNMVKAAYSSGTPAIGVGKGNAPAWICSDADLEVAARTVIDSKSFDNGLLCGSENHLVVDASVRQGFMSALEANGAAVLAPQEIKRFTSHVMDPQTGHLRLEVIGQSAQHIAHRAGIRRDRPIRLLVVPVDQDEMRGPYGGEKLAPILSLFTVDGQEEGLALCKRLLAREGAGHTAIVHTQDPRLAERYGLEMPASRILVNTPGSQGCCGISTGLTPSAVLGCGTLGGGSTSDNVTYTHLRNIKRVAYAL